MTIRREPLRRTYKRVSLVRRLRSGKEKVYSYDHVNMTVTVGLRTREALAAIAAFEDVTASRIARRFIREGIKRWRRSSQGRQLALMGDAHSTGTAKESGHE